MKSQTRRQRDNTSDRKPANRRWPADTKDISELFSSLQKLFSTLGIKDRIRFSSTLKVDKPRKGSRLPSANIVGNLLTNWHQDVLYLDRFGEPVPLTFDGRPISFRALCRKVAPTIAPRQVLNELIKLRVVQRDPAGLISPTTRSLPMYSDSELATIQTIRALRDFADTLRHNLRTADSARDHLFFRMAWNGELPATKIPRLKIWLKRHGQELLESADNWMADAARGSSHRKRNYGSKAQATIGIYMALKEGKKYSAR